MNSKGLSALLVPLAAALIGGCSSDSMSPRDIAGLYGLTQVDAEDLPATTDSTATTVTKVTQGTLSIDPDGRYTMAVLAEETPVGGGSTNPVLFSEMGILSFTGDNELRFRADNGSTWTGIAAFPEIRVAILFPDASDQALELTFRRGA
ncbi:MAG: hypothetical protein JSU87_11510 [Gemmatimonadota bacterium]|nr:MAG: hypothetical protein JSU87_11510 [Gemmatimonadota bacterium]